MVFSLYFKIPVPLYSFVFYLTFLPCMFTLHNGNETDRQALLAIKAGITEDPYGTFTSWNDSVHFCKWTGVTCGHLHQRVTKLNLTSLDLVGTLSPDIGNLTFLTELNLELNNFHGKIPPQVGGLFGLKHVYLTNNSFSGAIPINLSRCSNLVVLSFGWNKLSGKIPLEFGSLQKLERFHVHNNNLSGVIPETLGNLSSIKSLSLSVNSFKGTIPSSLGQLKTLSFLGLGVNKLSGVVPDAIFNLSSLEIFTVPYNQLYGTLPSEFGFSLPRLKVLNIGHNWFTGPLPKSLSNASNLVKLDANGSNFTGKVSIDFGGLSNLWWLILASNSIDDLSFFNSLSRCRNLKVLDLSDCKFGGVLPDSITNLSSTLLSLRLGGTIPSSLSSLRGLEELDLSRNNLSSQIPRSLQLISLKRLNLSFNQFEGQVPTDGVFKNASAISISGNEKLCGGIPELKLPICPNTEPKGRDKSSSIKLMIPLLSGVLALVLMMSLVIIFRLRKSRGEPSPSLTSSLTGCFMRVTYDSLYRATNGFSSANLIGIGSYSSVYKGVLDQGERLVAVKVINIDQQGAFKSFMAECEALRNIRHQNLAKIYTACSTCDFEGNPFKALVYEYMPNGSLESWLHPTSGVDASNNEVRILSLVERLNISIDVACALEYLHHHCHKPILHSDLKPENILLDNDMTAHVADFGLAKFFVEAMSKYRPNPSSSIGYAAPEYSMGGKASAFGDVYSYGILLLEMFSGKRPTDSMFKDGLTLHNFAKIALPETIDEIVDPMLLPSSSREKQEEEEGLIDPEDSSLKQAQECLISIIQIGVACSVESPRERMDIGDVVKELQLIRDILLASHAIHSSTSGSLRFEGSSSRSVASNWQNFTSFHLP
ncbi:putative receptor-like protein kinase At3g47110 isoform X2 [Lycium ferocissimum]|uniref:putative receptor-like protein kinase At3g47110 isoform X2 n=1 Tax=Lycium ferocissimum TaxID=112874 RepID=UPI00281559FB|nr:putative receptor-like protein kinase At3g47110 isoform X2 [Lycium ferocissimum]